MRRIGGIFGTSPFGPMHEHILKVLDCLAALSPLVAAAADGDSEGVKRAAADIRRLEEEADAIKKAIRLRFTTSVLSAVTRSEVWALVKAQDDIADQCDGLAFDLAVRRTRFPDFLTDDARAFVGTLSAAIDPLSEISRILDESGARITAREREAIGPLIDKVERVAAGSLDVEKRFLSRLFEREKEAAVLDVVFLTRFAEGAQKVAGKIENVADILTRIIAEEK